MSTLSEHAEALQWGLDELSQCHEAGGVTNDPEIKPNMERFQAAVDHVRFAASHEQQQIMDGPRTALNFPDTPTEVLDDLFCSEHAPR